MESERLKEEKRLTFRLDVNKQRDQLIFTDSSRENKKQRLNERDKTMNDHEDWIIETNSWEKKQKDCEKDCSQDELVSLVVHRVNS